MKTVVLVASCFALALTACNSEQNFTLNVRKDLTVSTRPGSSSTVIVRPGTYALNLSIGDVTTKVTLTGNDGKELVFRTRTLKSIASKFRSEKDVEETLSASQLGQPFDLRFRRVKTVLSSGPLVTRKLDCVSGSYTTGGTSCSGGGLSCVPGFQGDLSDCRPEPMTCTDNSVTHDIYGTRTARGRDTTYTLTTELILIENGDVKAEVRKVSPKESDFVEVSSTECGSGGSGKPVVPKVPRL